MDSIRVLGGTPLQGRVRIQGSKNAALPILAACLMTGGAVSLRNIPKISDVYGMLQILSGLGCKIQWKQDCLVIDPADASSFEANGEDASSMRSSLFLLGPLLARHGRASLGNPGGCVIGSRPIDIHLEALKAMGVQFECSEGGLKAKAKDLLSPADVSLRFPSVGATENVLMAAMGAKGDTRIHGAAREPEVVALCEFLNSAGGDVRGTGGSELLVRGGRRLHGTEFAIPADRIVAGTYLMAGFMTGGSILLEEAPETHMGAVLMTAKGMGARITSYEQGIYAQYPERARSPISIKTQVYPGFPTDLQSVALAACCKARGNAKITETIFENRFRIREELVKMGARICQENEKTVRVSGVKRLWGSQVEAKELRGGAALVVAALGAEGESRISGRHFIERGYENICRDLRELGARIVSE